MNEVVTINKLTESGPSAFLLFNKKAYTTLGYTREEFLKLTPLDIIHSEYAQIQKEAIEKLLVDGKATFEAIHKHKSGKDVNIKINATLIRDPDGIYVIVIAENLTELTKANNLIKILNTAFKHNPASIMITDDKGVIEYANPKFYETSGYTPKEIIGAKPNIVKSGHHNKDFYDKMWSTLTSGKVWKSEFLNKKANGEQYWEYEIISPVYDDNDKLINFIAVKEDITLRKNAEIKLKASEKNLNQFFNNSLAGFFIMTFDEPVDWLPENESFVLEYMLDHLRFTKVNQAFCNQYGMTKEEFMSITLRDMFQHNIDSAKEVFCEFFNKRVMTFVTDERKKDGSQIWIEGVYNLTYNENGQITGHFGTQYEVTDRVIAEITLKESEFKYRKLFHNAQIGVCLSNYNGKVLESNYTIARIYGHEYDDFLNLNVKSLYKNNKDRIEIVHELLAYGSSIDNQVEMIRKDNSIIHVNLNLSVINIHGEEHIISTHFDVTAKQEIIKNLKESENQLKELNSSKDKFFSIIAHDLRGPFSGFLGLTELLSTEWEQLPVADVKRMTKAIFESAKSVYQLLNDLLLWSTTQLGSIKFEPEMLDLFDLTSSNVFLLRDTAKNKTIELELICRKNTLVYCDRNMITTVIRNLIDNAIKFTPENGKVKIYSERFSNYIKVCVEDNGCGMDASVSKNLFNLEQKLSTLGTKGEKGTGLGLKLCKEFIDMHDGEIWAESEKGIGTKVFFTLPNSN